MPRSKGRTGRPWRRAVEHVLAARPLVCQLCFEEIDPDLPYRDSAGRVNPGYKTVHHLIPISRGGDELDLDNLVPAHLLCNLEAGDKMPWELQNGSDTWIVGESP